MLTLLAAASFSFDGGTPSDLAQVISDAMERPAVIAYSKKRLNGAAFPWTDPTDYRDKIRRYFKFEPTEGSSMGFGPKTIPDWILDKDLPEKFLVGGTVSVQDGKVTAKPAQGMYLLAETLKRQPFSKPITMHWIVEMTPIATVAEADPEADFIQAVVCAVGGKLTDDNKIDLPSKTLRTRIVNTYDEMIASAKTRADAAHYALDEAFINQLETKDFDELFAKSSGSKTVEGQPGSALYNAAWAYARADAANFRTQPSQATQRARAMVDAQQPVRITYRVREGSTVSLLGRDGKVRIQVPAQEAARHSIRDPGLQRQVSPPTDRLGG